MNAEILSRLESTFPETIEIEPVTALREIVDRATSLMKLFEEED
ncbi:hypothetical protein [Rhizobium sp. TAL182]|nr:hypothetical protein [Rhizobium sp. TAL182]